MDKERVPTIRDLYPDLNDAELAEAEDNLDRYIALVAGIVERLEREGHLTSGIQRAAMHMRLRGARG